MRQESPFYVAGLEESNLGIESISRFPSRHLRFCFYNNSKNVTKYTDIQYIDFYIIVIFYWLF